MPVAYIQDDCSKVQVFNMINTTDSLYPKLIPIRFSKPGETSSSLRIGVVSAAGGQTRWLDVPGDPADNYILQPFWAKDSTEIFFQHMNREQNRNELMAGDPRTGRIRTVMVDTRPGLARGRNRPALADRRDEVHLGQQGSQPAGAGFISPPGTARTPSRSREIMTPWASRPWTRPGNGFTTWPLPSTLPSAIFIAPRSKAAASLNA